MADIFATRSDWLLHAAKLEGYDILVIHPRGDLTPKTMVEALAIQKLLFYHDRPRFRIVEHGTKIMMQRTNP